jgi:uncharacterized protein YuzE
MAARTVRVWFDADGDYLEVLFDRGAGYFRETASDQVMAKVNEEGDILGFSILRPSAPQQAPMDIFL